MYNVIIINGPNLNLLGNRETDIYGEEDFETIFKDLKTEAEKNNIKLSNFQSNEEGKIIDKIHSVKGFDYIIINPGALTHYSYSLHDALTSIDTPAIEVHITNIYRREEWRRKSVISPAVNGVISGFGVYVYNLALLYTIYYLNK